MQRRIGHVDGYTDRHLAYIPRRERTLKGRVLVLAANQQDALTRLREAGRSQADAVRPDAGNRTG